VVVGVVGHTHLKCILFLTCFFWGGGAATPYASPPRQPSIFSDYSFCVHHPVNRDDQHLLARAMASDFSVTWKCFYFLFFMPSFSSGCTHMYWVYRWKSILGLWVWKPISNCSHWCYLWKTRRKMKLREI
jgi:hypothetical protein